MEENIVFLRAFLPRLARWAVGWRPPPVRHMQCCCLGTLLGWLLPAVPAPPPAYLPGLRLSRPLCWMSQPEIAPPTHSTHSPHPTTHPPTHTRTHTSSRSCDKAAVFLLDDFDLFAAKRAKQTLLYNLLDALQTSGMQVGGLRRGEPSRVAAWQHGRTAHPQGQAGFFAPCAARWRCIHLLCPASARPPPAPNQTCAITGPRPRRRRWWV